MILLQKFSFPILFVDFQIMVRKISNSRKRWESYLDGGNINTTNIMTCNTLVKNMCVVPKVIFTKGDVCLHLPSYQDILIYNSK